MDGIMKKNNIYLNPEHTFVKLNGSRVPLTSMVWECTNGKAIVTNGNDSAGTVFNHGPICNANYSKIVDPRKLQLLSERERASHENAGYTQPPGFNAIASSNPTKYAVPLPSLLVDGKKACGHTGTCSCGG
jgi:hypothetical protein